MKPNTPLILALSLAMLGVAPACTAQGAIRDKIAERRAEDAAVTRITAPGDYDFTMMHDGLKRRYLVHVPRSFSPSTGMPVVIGLHGGGGHAEHFANDSNYGVITASEKHGFIAVIPNGYSKRRNGHFATWNAGGCCGDARDGNIDDAGFIRAMIQRVTRQLPVDEDRIYAMGMSNGGMMSYRLACEMPDVLAGIMSVAGTDNTTSCPAAQPIPILHVHALDDTHVLYNGGAGEDAFRDPSKVTEFTSVPATIEAWTARNHAASKPVRVKEVEGAWCDLYPARPGGAPVKLCVTTTGGHSWPGASRTRKGKPPASQAINANDEMWAYFLRLSRKD